MNTSGLLQSISEGPHVNFAREPNRPKIEFIAYIYMPPKELWEAYSNRTVRPSRFVSGAYLLYSLR